MFKYFFLYILLSIIINFVNAQNLYTLVESSGANGDDTNEKQFKYINRL